MDGRPTAAKVEVGREGCGGSEISACQGEPTVDFSEARCSLTWPRRCVARAFQVACSGTLHGGFELFDREGGEVVGVGR